MKTQWCMYTHRITEIYIVSIINGIVNWCIYMQCTCIMGILNDKGKLIDDYIYGASWACLRI